MKVAEKGKSEHLYLQIAENIQSQILSEVLKIGDKLPSVRVLAKEHNLSVRVQYCRHTTTLKARLKTRLENLGV